MLIAVHSFLMYLYTCINTIFTRSCLHNISMFNYIFLTFLFNYNLLESQICRNVNAFCYHHSVIYSKDVFLLKIQSAKISVRYILKIKFFHEYYFGREFCIVPRHTWSGREAVTETATRTAPHTEKYITLKYKGNFICYIYI